MRALIFVLLLLPSIVFADEPRAILLGHNLTPTTYTLPRYGFTAGNYILGFGITDKITIATSPWLYESYNMYSAITRVRGQLSESLDWAVQAMYLETGRFGKNQYQQKSIDTSFVVKHDFAPYYSLNLALNYMHFFDETAPFSLRREPYNDDAYQVSLTTLQEFRMPGGFGFLFEFGILGVNYVYPEMHYGVSFSHRSDWTLVQLGFSQTFTAGTLSRLFDTNQITALTGGQPGYDFSMHPEVQLQLFF